MTWPPGTPVRQPAFPQADSLSPRELSLLRRRWAAMARTVAVPGGGARLQPHLSLCGLDLAEAPTGAPWPALWAELDIGAEPEPGALCLAADAASAIVNGLLGHPGAPAGDRLTALDVFLVQTWLEDVLARWVASLDAPRATRLGRMGSAPVALATGVRYLQIGFGDGLDGRAYLRLWVPVGTVRAVALASATASREAGAALQVAMLDVGVRLQGRLAAADVPSAELAALEPGDVLVLDEIGEQPDALLANGVPVFTGRVGLRDGCLAFEVGDWAAARS